MAHKYLQLARQKLHQIKQEQAQIWYKTVPQHYSYHKYTKHITQHGLYTRLTISVTEVILLLSLSLLYETTVPH